MQRDICQASTCRHHSAARDYRAASDALKVKLKRSQRTHEASRMYALEDWACDASAANN